MPGRVVIILLNYNNTSRTLACLRTLQRIEYPSWSALVVENASEPEERARLEQALPRFPFARLIASQVNAGFCGGNNIGIREALDSGAAYVWILNNDTEVAPETLSVLVDACEGDSTIGAVGSKIYFLDRPDTVWFFSATINWHNGRSYHLGCPAKDSGQFAALSDSERLCGCSMLITRAALEHAGMFDERFFLYVEDQELSVRIRRAGFRLVAAPLSKVWHAVEDTSADDHPKQARLGYYLTRNRLLFLTCHGSWFATMRTLVSSSLKGLRLTWHPKKHRLGQAMLWACFDFASGRFGQCARRISLCRTGA